jgi:V/A-type H+-transporting ATPase subunit F
MSGSDNKRIAVMGSKDTVLIFKAVGMDVFFTDTADPRTVLEDLFDKEYAVILITERDAVLAGGLIASVSDKPYPVILPIPDGVGRYGLSADRISADIEKLCGGLK